MYDYSCEDLLAGSVKYVYSCVFVAVLHLFVVFYPCLILSLVLHTSVQLFCVS